MKSYLSLIPISAKVRRKQNRLTIICIILAVFLVASTFSMADIWSKGETEAMIKKHGNYHIVLDNIPEEQAEMIAAGDNVSAAAWCREFGEEVYEGYGSSGKRVVFYGADASYIYDIRNYETEGAYPADDREVMLSADAKETSGFRIGDSIVINTPAGDFSYTVSGFCTDDADYNSRIGGFCAYMGMSALEELCAANGEPGSPVCYIQFSKGTKLKKAIAGIKEQYGLSDGQVEENIITVGMSGAGSTQNMNGMYVTAVILFVLVLIAGVLMISSCMNSNVAQRIRFFGMMRCIGVSKSQVMHFVRLEALNWCKTAIPAGCILSIAVTWIACTVLKNLVGGEFSEFSFRISPIGMGCGILVGIVTVLLAAHSPAKRAADISPMAAVSGNAETGKGMKHAANTRLFKVESALGIYHAVSAKKNLILLSLSFALTVTLFLTFFACFDLVRKLLPSTGSFAPDVEIVSADNDNSMDRSIKAEIAALPGVEAVMGNSVVFDMPVEINGAEGVVDFISYDDFMFEASKKSVVSGDLSKVAGNSDYVMTIYNEGSRLNTGDRIRTGDTELEIACAVSEGIGGWGKPLIVCTEETFTRITGEEKYILLNAVLSKDAEEETVSAVQMLAEGNVFHDRREEKEDNYGSYWVFRIAAYGFLAIIALITVFNIMNSISMSVSARMKQYGAMRAVGMSTRQLTKMIAAEAATYALCGMALGVAAGLCLHRLFTVKIIIEHFGGVWRIPLDALGIIVLLVLFSCVIAVYTPAKRMREMAVTETLNEL